MDRDGLVHLVGFVTTARYAYLARESVKTSAAKAAESIGSDMVGSR